VTCVGVTFDMNSDATFFVQDLCQNVELCPYLHEVRNDCENVFCFRGKYRLCNFAAHEILRESKALVVKFFVELLGV
jgi:hypothetical protein